MVSPPHHDAFYFLQTGDSPLTLNPQENSTNGVAGAPGPRNRSWSSESAWPSSKLPLWERRKSGNQLKKKADEIQDSSCWKDSRVCGKVLGLRMEGLSLNPGWAMLQESALGILQAWGILEHRIRIWGSYDLTYLLHRLLWASRETQLSLNTVQLAGGIWSNNHLEW